MPLTRRTYAVGGATLLAILVFAIIIFASSPAAAAASPSDIEVSPDCSRITIKNRAAVMAKVGLAVLQAAPEDDTPVRDILIEVLRLVVPKCTWPPAAGGNPTFAGLLEFGAPEDEERWIDVLNTIGDQTWGDVKSLGVLDFAPAPGTGADSRALQAGVALLAALGWGLDVERGAS